MAVNTKPISIAQPFIGDEEKQAVMRVLDSGQLVQGAVVAEFEQAFAAFCGAKHAIATSNGTTALTVALMAAGIGLLGGGSTEDEVIIPSFTFMATATSLLSVAARPVFVDIEMETFCLDPAKIEAAITPKTRAIMPVHLYGHPANMSLIRAIADKHGLALIEDAAQAHGAAIGADKVGTFGHAAAFSFYPSKNMTTGEGGMITTNDDELASKARMIRQHGMNTQYYHERVGLNYRLTNIAAAIGVEQLKRLPAWNAQRIQNGNFLTEHLTSVRAPVVAANATHVYHQFTVIVPEGADRDGMMKRLNERGVGVRVYYPLPVHRQPVMQQLGYDKFDLPVTENLTQRVFSLPVHPFLSPDDLERIVDEVNSLA
jgi:perosamine synthetase